MEHGKLMQIVPLFLGDMTWLRQKVMSEWHKSHVVYTAVPDVETTVKVATRGDQNDFTQVERSFSAMEIAETCTSTNSTKVVRECIHHRSM